MRGISSATEVNKDSVPCSWFLILNGGDHLGDLGVHERIDSNIKIIQKEIRCECLNGINLPLDRIQWLASTTIIMNLSLLLGIRKFSTI
jgi:hypothetical protein